MLRRTISIVTVFLLLAASFPILSGDPSPEPGSYGITLTSDHVAVVIANTWYTNLTGPEGGLILPLYSFVVEGENATNLASALTSSVARKNPGATVTELVMSAESNGTMVRYMLEFTMAGVSHTDNWEYTQVDLAWRSFKVDDDIWISGAAFNLVGKHYLAERLLEHAKRPPTRFVRTIFELNGQGAVPLEIERLAPDLNLLDFSQLSTSLSDWSRRFQLADMTTSWSQTTNFDLVATVIITEPVGEQTRESETLSFSMNVLIETPGLATDWSDTVFFGEGFLELLMAGTIALATTVMAGTFLVDRRLSSMKRFKPKKR